jgi:hypothetical protein
MLEYDVYRPSQIITGMLFTMYVLIRRERKVRNA